MIHEDLRQATEAGETHRGEFQRPMASARDTSGGFWPVDWASLSFLTCIVVLLLTVFDEAPNAWLWLVLDSFFIGALFYIRYRTRNVLRGKALSWRIVHLIATIVCVFTELGSVVPYVNPTSYERELFEFDIALFGANPLEELERISNPWLTEALQWIYDYYYFIAILLGAAIARRGRPLDLARTMFGFATCIYASYVGYFFVPATGPNIDKFELYRFQTELPGVFLATELRETLAAIEQIKQDCFPSGHTAVSLLAFMLALRFARGAAWIMAPLVLALIFSTMYLRYHYVADVLAGIVLALISYWGSLALHRRFEKRVGWIEEE